jgi:hypothetical protein
MSMMHTFDEIKLEIVDSLGCNESNELNESH